MSINLSEYKNFKIKEVDYFLRNINFNNIGKKDSKIIDYPSPECDTFFNSNEGHRKLTEEFLRKVKELYSNLLYIDIDFAGSKEEVDKGIHTFANKLMDELNKYKYQLIAEEFGGENKKIVSGMEITFRAKENNLINTGLNFMRIKIGDKVYKFPKNNTEAEREDVTLNNLNIMIIYTYVIICMIKDKKMKKEEFMDYVRETFELTDSKYVEALQLQKIFLQEKNYNEFILRYNMAMEEVKTLSEENKPKTR